MVVAILAATMGWSVGTCDVAKRKMSFVTAASAAAQVYVSMQFPLKLLGPPKPRQRAMGTMHSHPPASRMLAISTFFLKVGSNVVSARVMAQALEQLEPKIPSFSLFSLKSGLPASRYASRLVISFFLNPSRRGWPHPDCH